jgi:hypothetical protein
MSIEDLLEGAESYTSLAEVAAAGPEIDTPQSIGPILRTISHATVATIQAGC